MTDAREAAKEAPARVDPLSLIGRPFVFTQQPLLEPDAFRRAAGERGYSLWPEQLEALHRVGALVPLYVVRRPRWDIRIRQQTADPSASIGRRRWGVPTHGPDLAEDARARLVRRGLDTRFRPWSRELVQTPLGPVKRHEHLYSSYQLLDLPAAMQWLPAQWRRRRRLGRDAPARLRQAAEASEGRVALLSALEAVYLPGIVLESRAPHPITLEQLSQYADSCDPVEEGRGLGWTADDLRAAAVNLLWEAHTIDPLDDWVELVSQVHPDRWERLRGAARLAIDLRVAAEMILRFHEALQRHGKAPPFPPTPRRWRHDLTGRLRQDRAELDRILTDYGLSPYPAVILALEGPTEMLAVRHVMEHLGIPRADAFIRLVDAGGENRDHGFLAAYVTLPELGPIEHGVAEFVRAPTRYFIAVDGDRHFRTLEARESERQKWIKLLFNKLPTSMQTPEARQDLEWMVLVETWQDGLDFERAHFSDAELAQAILSVGKAPDGMSAADVQAKLAMQRGGGGSLDKVWKGWPMEPAKPAIAEALWPTLRTRIDQAADEGKLDDISVARVVVRAYRLAASTPRRNVVFRVGPDAP